LRAARGGATTQATDLILSVYCDGHAYLLWKRRRLTRVRQKYKRRNKNSTPQLSFDAHQHSASLVLFLLSAPLADFYCLYSAAQKQYKVMASSGFQRSWVHSHSIIRRAFCQRATQNIDLAV
jgi:hypothetical protein